MPSSSPDEGSKLSGLHRRIAKHRSRLRFLRHSNSRYAASSSCSDRLTSLTQSAEPYPCLKDLANIVTDLCANVNVSIG
ncbi:hypothetical protein K435DRAFT_773272 [Dendrothele bispora CBS 962.96]|uniref:Uncharacterized protein n=1 Tax=Dendrothele bispora (strain CBS 962.96) TaxID=1314807 RepID=A0A4S8MU48_DENBC|nr:hypothetical protein K435DRAFT_773272 [Dendrothele bispora CBS 962.96]